MKLIKAMNSVCVYKVDSKNGCKMNLAAKFKWGGWYTADSSTLQQSSCWRWPRDGEFCTTRQGHINSSGKATISCSKENSKLESKGKTTGWWWEPHKTSTTLWVQYLQRAVHDGSVQICKPKIAKGLQHTRWWKRPLDNNWFRMYVFLCCCLLQALDALMLFLYVDFLSN